MSKSSSTAVCVPPPLASAGKLHLAGISKSFGPVDVLYPLDLTVEVGEFLVLVGPSGCGKSTLLRLIAGLETPTTGEIYINNTLVNQVAPKDRDIAMVFQNYALYPHMSVWDNLAFGLKMRKTPRAELMKRVEQTAERLELTPLLKRKPKELSGGQRQRVALGRAIVREPQLFLMDEPLSNLDARLRQQTRHELAQLHHSLAQTTGASTVYVTHDQVEALTLGHRIAVLNAGKLEQVATPQEVYQRPQTLFVASFIGQLSVLQAAVKGETLTLGPELSWPLEQSAFWVEKARSLQQITLGIRPESWQVVADNTPSSLQQLCLTGTLTSRELLGSEQQVQLAVEGLSSPLLVRLPAQQLVALGQRLTVAVAPQALHAFCATTGQRLG